jgi:DNA-binding transcriptional MerR regulator
MAQNSEFQIEPKYRIGAIAKLSGVAIATLRVWQRRYGVVQPQKSSGGQRLFDDADLSKLKCIKELIDLGFAIGTLAHLKPEELSTLKTQTLLKRGLTRPQATESGLLRLGLIGHGLQDKFTALDNGAGFDGPNVKIEKVFADASEAIEFLRAQDSQSLDAMHSCVLKISTLQMSSVQTIRELQAGVLGVSLGVVFNYANPEVLVLLKTMGIEMLRSPFQAEELISFVKALRSISGLHARANLPNVSRRFSARDLEIIRSHKSTVSCECPSHLAQIVEQLASFEQYSRECLSVNPKDKALHAMLTQVSLQALLMFERALEDVMSHEKIILPASSSAS